MKKFLPLLAALLTFIQPCAADSFSYDALNRLTRVAFANGTAIDYAYDATGNLLSTANITLFTSPNAPMAVVATASNASAGIAFTAPANNGGDAISAYTATSTPDGFMGSCTAPCTAIVVNGLSNGTAYTFTVTAANNAGASPPSVGSNSVTPLAPVVTFTASTSAGANGTISPASLSVTSGNATSFTVTPNTGYTASASGCDGSLNGSIYTTGAITVDCTVSATFTQNAIQAGLVAGWNLLGNSVNVPLDVIATLGDANKVTTVWKWVPATSKWAFYAPSMTAPNLATYAAGKGYDVLATINGGEGFWVNAKAAFSAQLPAGTAISSLNFVDQSLPPNNLSPGWSLIAIGDSKTPRAFATAISTTTPVEGTVPTSLATLWAWDSTLSSWYFYAPSLDNSGGLAGYITSKGYLNFGAKTLDPTMGFWVNHP